MKTKTLLSLLALTLAFGLQPSAFLQAAPLGTAFSYQGKLTDAGKAANGIYDLCFTICAAASGGSPLAGPITNSPVGVTNGLFTTALDFGSDVFTGEARWLEIAARTNGGGAFTPLSPRQPLTPAPYALYAPSAGTAVSATTASIAASVVANGVATASLQANAVTSAKIADGTIMLADLAQNGATNGQVIRWSTAQNRWMVDSIGGSGSLAGYRENGAFAAAPVASGNNAIAIGEHAQALGNNSVVEGGLDNTANHLLATVSGG
ncbi:MAG: hypothetical protein QHJ82_14175 [Verrucomicrobiota bacterium]|nr:hypothetical protein [Verrucomicrobiota bacterium]